MVDNCLVTDILQNIFFCVQPKIETHTGLKPLLVVTVHIERVFYFQLCLLESIAPVVWRPVCGLRIAVLRWTAGPLHAAVCQLLPSRIC